MSKWISNRLGIVDDNKISEHSFRTRILVSVLCMMVCMTAMLSSAYAWFVVSVTSDKNVISGASYVLDITLNNGNTTGNVDEIYGCELTYNDEYYYTLKSGGTASKGYCKISITDLDDTVTSYYTPEIPNGESLEVCIQAASESKISFVPMWGTYEAQTVYSLRRPSVFTIQHSLTPHIEYLVVEGVTLEDLAEYYGVSVEDICVYNGITELEVGETIKIPGIEDDSIEPYMPPQAGVATPSNATPSDAIQKTGAESVTESALAAESSTAAESTPEAESSAATESTSVAESSASTESTSAAESSTAAESTPAVESSAATESTSVAETTITTESVPATEAENLPESTSATQSESVIFTAPNPTSSDAASSGEEPADPSIPPEMSTEDIEEMSETEATEPGAETEATSEPS